MAEVDVLVRLVEDALASWRRPNRQSRGCDFPSDHMEVLTFFHGLLFRRICEVAEKDPQEFWILHGIPPPGQDCPCYSCRTDAAWEAMALATDRQCGSSEHRFRPGEVHHVYWNDDHIQRVIPEGDGPTLGACEYLQRIQ